jgi:hypothetical protein
MIPSFWLSDQTWTVLWRPESADSSKYDPSLGVETKPRVRDIDMGDELVSFFVAVFLTY